MAEDNVAWTDVYRLSNILRQLHTYMYILYKYILIPFTDACITKYTDPISQCI